MALPTALVAAGLAAAAPQTAPLPGPGQVVQPVPPPPAQPAKQPDVIVLPGPGPAAAPEEFDELQDPAAQTAAPDAPAGDAAAPAADSANAAATDPFEDELALQIKPADDPLEGFNRISFAVSMALDKVLLRPLALAFQAVTPKPLRDGMRNLLSNWNEPLVFINDILQLKPKRALRTLGRFLLNTLVGVGGLFDIAKDKKFNLPHHDNRFADTLAFYGVKPGPYLYLPILGPTTLRDEADRVQTFIPLFDNPIFRDNRGIAFTVASGLEERANNDQELKALLEDAVDPYATFRETWLQQRRGQTEQLKAADGQEAGVTESSTLDTSLDDPLVDPAGAAGVDPAPADPGAQPVPAPTPAPTPATTLAP